MILVPPIKNATNIHIRTSQYVRRLYIEKKKTVLYENSIQVCNSFDCICTSIRYYSTLTDSYKVSSSLSRLSPLSD